MDVDEDQEDSPPPQAVGDLQTETSENEKVTQALKLKSSMKKIQKHLDKA